jgi:hypothetical protein
MKRLIEIQKCLYVYSHINTQSFLLGTVVSTISPVSQVLTLTAAQPSHLEASL